MARKAKKLPYVMTEDELKALLSQPNPKCPTGLRNLCMMKLMADAGLRVAEVLNLKVKDNEYSASPLSCIECGSLSDSGSPLPQPNKPV